MTRPEPSPMRPEPVEGQEPGASTRSARMTRPEPSSDRSEPSPKPAEPPPTRPEPVEGREAAASTSPTVGAQPDFRGSAGGESDDTKLGSEPDPAQPAPGAKFTVTDVRRLWPEVLEEVKGKRRFTWILLSQNAQVAELRNGVMVLTMANVGARDSFSRGGSEDVLREALVVVLGADFKIETLVEGGPSAPPPVARPAPVDQQAAASWDAPAPPPAPAPSVPAEPVRDEAREQ